MEQTVISRLGTGYTRLKYYVFSKLQLVGSFFFFFVTCGSDKMGAKYMLELRPTCAEHEELFWLTTASCDETLYGDVGKLNITAAFFTYAQADV